MTRAAPKQYNLFGEDITPKPPTKAEREKAERAAYIAELNRQERENQRKFELLAKYGTTHPLEA